MIAVSWGFLRESCDPDISIIANPREIAIAMIAVSYLEPFSGRFLRGIAWHARCNECLA